MTQRSDGLWQEKVRLPDGKYKYFYAKTKAELKNKLMEWDDKPKGKPVKDAVREYLESIEGKLSPNTMPSYYRYCDYFEDYYNDSEMGQITPRSMNDFIEYYITTKKLSRKSACNMLSVCSQICTYAVGSGWMEYNPCRDIQIRRNLPQGKRLPPPDDEIRLIADIEEFNLATFLLFTGLRRGEAIALKWSDFDMENKTISVHTGTYFVGNHPHEKSTKTVAGNRTVPIPDKILPYINPSEGYVFPDKNGNMMANSYFRRYWEGLQYIYGFKCTPHQLRHAYTNLLVESAGLTFAEAAAMLGHENSSTTEQQYYSMRDERKKAIIEQARKIQV